MAGFLHWLAPKYALLQQTMPQELALLRQNVAVDGHLRTPGIVAQLALGLQTFLAYAAECGAITDGQHEALWQRGWAALCDVAEQQAVQQTQEDDVQRFLSALAGALTAGDAHAADAHRPGAPCEWPEWGWRREVNHSENDIGSQRTTTTWRAQGRCIGWVDGERLYLDPEAAYSVADRFAATHKRGLVLSAQTLWKRLHERGLLRRDPSQDKNKVKRTIGAKRPYVIDIAVSLIYAP
jgi:hypothetical protein